MMSCKLCCLNWNNVWWPVANMLVRWCRPSCLCCQLGLLPQRFRWQIVWILGDCHSQGCVFCYWLMLILSSNCLKVSFRHRRMLSSKLSSLCDLSLSTKSSYWHRGTNRRVKLQSNFTIKCLRRRWWRINFRPGVECWMKFNQLFRIHARLFCRSQKFRRTHLKEIINLSVISCIRIYQHIVESPEMKLSRRWLTLVVLSPTISVRCLVRRGFLCSSGSHPWRLSKKLFTARCYCSSGN